ncbi:MAG: S8 family serine peptidase [Clostridia bacterium]|nr:S8 family serine peptidase [Clostridia bacterium]
MKRKLSVLLVLCLLLNMVMPVFAMENTEETTLSDEVAVEAVTELASEEAAELEEATEVETGVTESASEAASESVTEEEEALAEEVTENVIEAEAPSEEVIENTNEEATETESEDAVETELSDDETYMLNIVLFAMKENATLKSIKDELEELDISRVVPLFVDEDGNAKPIGKKNEVWYRAYTLNDVYETVDALTELKGVTYAEPEYIYTSDYHGMPDEFDKNRDWPHHKHLHKGDDEFWWETEYNHDYAPGYGTIVAVIDTGVDYTHEDLASNMWINTAELDGTEGVDDDLNGYIDDIYGVDTTASGKKAGNPMDDNGHGTHVAGIIGMSANGMGGIGLAYGTKIMAIKAGQSTGTLASSHIAKAINYAHMMGADVINMSFGGSGRSYLVETALEDAFSDCVLVASAGNDGIPTTDAPDALYPKRADQYPAGYSYVLGVMATEKNSNLASFSNWDYKPNENAEYELTAPGVDIYSTLPDNRYAEWSGTSMAAPFVSATAAIIRSHYDDKDTYSSRFIMGQISSATTEKTAFTAPEKEYYEYPALNVYDSIYYLPKPNLSVKDMFLMDNKENGEINDGDAIIDAGEVIDLGILVRNQWGQTGDITVKANAISNGGVANPWIEFITDEVTLQSAGTFQEVDNGFIYDDSLLTGVDNPIRFKVSSEIPNDTQIKINITVTTTNGIDKNDNATYTVATEYVFSVQAGRGISGTLAEDTTLTNDYLWIIENSLYIPEGITLTIEPGTQVQFYSSDYEDAYGGKTRPYINCDGVLNAIGTEEEPIEMFPGSGFENYVVKIYGKGIETLKYCNIINPKFGESNTEAIWEIDHCILTQNYLKVYERDHDYGSPNAVFSCYVNKLTNSLLRNIRRDELNCRYVYTEEVSNNVHEDCVMCYRGIGSDGSIHAKNNVFITSNNRIDFPESPLSNSLILGNIYYDQNSENKYITIKLSDYDYRFENEFFEAYRIFARSLGGDWAVINDDSEAMALKSMGVAGVVGAMFNPGTGQYEWIDGTDYLIDTSSMNFSVSSSYRFVNFISGKFYNMSSIGYNYFKIIEVPADISDEEITTAIANFDYNEAMKEYWNSTFINNAVLNPVLNNNPNTWTVLTANYHDIQLAAHYVSGNYWGTENKTLINKMITDADDYAGTYQDIVTDPILTLESESLQDIYPFVTKVYLTDGDGNIVSNVQPGETYDVHVHFNRDMDMGTQPSVSYGGATPYTDYMVEGDFVSEREWVGTIRISPVMTSGTMCWRTKGGCAADDNWLVCGEDVLRFSFNVSTTGVLAMLLNAEGGANKVELSWAQNDYETLAGYNIYRSTEQISGFSKINVSVVTDTEYTDTDVEPGVMYYYYFKVVNTDGNEEASASNTASAAPIDNIFPVLKHSPVTSAKAGSQVTLSATATDNIGVTEVKLYYKTGNGKFKEKAMTEGATENLYVAVIPANAVTKAGVSYYVTAEDADGNVSYSGTKELPNVINVNADAYISGITPSKIATSGGKTVSVLGGNFTEDMTVKVGGEVIEDISFVDSGQINFVAPAKASGSYALTLTTTEGKVVASPTPLSYTDASSMAQIPTSMTMVSGVEYKMPLHITASGEIISLHAELDLPSSDFTKVTVEKANADGSFNLDYTYSGGVLKIGCIGTSDINSSEGAIVNIVVTPKVTEDKQYDITLHDVYFNDVEVNTVISGNVHIKPSFVINALVKYYKGTDNFVDGVTISVAGVSALTDTSGKAELTVAERNVTITASRTMPKYSITAYDASLVLQSAIGKITLDDNQKLAADVDGNGKVSEYDAALILQKAVRKIDAFPIGSSWVFVPSFADKTLSATSATKVEFVAISLGDVDGSYMGEEE